VVSNYAKIVPVLEIIENKPTKSANGYISVRVNFRLIDHSYVTKFYRPESQHQFPRMEWREYQKIKKSINAVKLIKEGDEWRIKQLLTG
jgi:hypothetical protein